MKKKIAVGKDYILPKALKDAGLTPEELNIADSVWINVVRPLGFDAGVRTLKRNIEALCRKAAALILSGQKEIIINEDNIKNFIPQW